MNNTDICNLALSYLGNQGILSINDNTQTARLCKTHYEHCRRIVLRSYTWGFAKKVEQLAQVDEKVAGWGYVYAYPQKCLGIRFIFPEELARVKSAKRSEFETVCLSDDTQGIATDVQNAWCEYTYDLTNAERFSEEFIEALARLLASHMAIELTGNTNIQDNNYQLYQAALNLAKLAVAQEVQQKPRWPLKYANARFSD